MNPASPRVRARARRDVIRYEFSVFATTPCRGLKTAVISEDFRTHLHARARKRQEKRNSFRLVPAPKPYTLARALTPTRQATSLSLKPTYAHEKRHKKHGLWCLGSGSSTTPATLWHKRASLPLTKLP